MEDESRDPLYRCPSEPSSIIAYGVLRDFNKTVIVLQLKQMSSI